MVERLLRVKTSRSVGGMGGGQRVMRGGKENGAVGELPSLIAWGLTAVGNESEPEGFSDSGSTTHCRAGQQCLSYVRSLRKPESGIGDSPVRQLPIRKIIRGLFRVLLT